MTDGIMKKLRLAFSLPPKVPVKKNKPFPLCPHCGKYTRVMTEDDAERERRKIKNFRRKLW